MERYILETKNTLYRVVDATSHFSRDRWMLIRIKQDGKGKQEIEKYPILLIGGLYEHRPGFLAKGGIDAGFNKFLKAVEKEIGDSISKKTCLGKKLFYVREKDFDRIGEAMKNQLPKVFWKTYEEKIYHTSEIKRIFKEI